MRNKFAHSFLLLLTLFAINNSGPQIGRDVTNLTFNILHFRPQKLKNVQNITLKKPKWTSKMKTDHFKKTFNIIFHFQSNLIGHNNQTNGQMRMEVLGSRFFHLLCCFGCLCPTRLSAAWSTFPNVQFHLLKQGYKPKLGSNYTCPLILFFRLSTWENLETNFWIFCPAFGCWFCGYRE